MVWVAPFNQRSANPSPRINDSIQSESGTFVQIHIVVSESSYILSIIWSKMREDCVSRLICTSLFGRVRNFITPISSALTVHSTQQWELSFLVNTHPSYQSQYHPFFWSLPDSWASVQSCLRGLHTTPWTSRSSLCSDMMTERPCPNRVHSTELSSGGLQSVVETYYRWSGETKRTALSLMAKAANAYICYISIF